MAQLVINVLDPFAAHEVFHVSFPARTILLLNLAPFESSRSTELDVRFQYAVGSCSNTMKHCRWVSQDVVNLMLQDSHTQPLECDRHISWRTQVLNVFGTQMCTNAHGVSTTSVRHSGPCTRGTQAALPRVAKHFSFTLIICILDRDSGAGIAC